MEEQITTILEKIKEIEARISQLEQTIKSGVSEPESYPGQAQSEEFNGLTVHEDFIEKHIGRYGLLWAGNLILVAGLIILSDYLGNIGKDIFAAATGFGSVAILVFISGFIRRQLPSISQMLNASALILLFNATARLHFSSGAPLLSSAATGLALLTVTLVLSHIMAIRSNSIFYGIIAILLTGITAMLGNQKIYTLTMVILTGGTGLLYFFRYRLTSLLFLAIIIVYGILVLWLFGNPLISHHFQILPAGQSVLTTALICGVLFSSVTLAPKRTHYTPGMISGIVLLNGFSFTFLLMLHMAAYKPEYYFPYLIIIFTGCLLLSVVLKLKSVWTLSAPYYAVYSFVVLSAIIYITYKIPGSFLLLTLESLLVLTIALWYRSRFIIIMNLLMFLVLLVSYLFISPNHNATNFAFALSGLISARVINITSNRFQIKTSLIRNTYLLAAFGMMLFALGHALPPHLVGMSWIGLAICYFVISLILHNQKYRWMSIGTLILSGIYLIFLQGDDVETTLKVLGFVILAVTSIFLSVFYTRYDLYTKKEKDTEQV